MSYMETLRRDLAKLEHEEKEAFKTKHLIISFLSSFFFLTFMKISDSISW